MKIVLDSHCHTVASGHAYSTVKECVEEAAEKGLELLAITDHCVKMPGASGLLHFYNLDSLPKQLFGVEILSGVELNILNDRGEVDMKNNILKRLDVVIASLHLPCITPGNCEYNTNAVINAMKNPYVKIIGHLGDPRYPMVIDKVLDTAKQTGTVIEINEKSSDPDSDVRSGGLEIIHNIIEGCMQRKINLTLGSDAHFYTEVGRLGCALDMIKKVGVPEELVLNTSAARFKEAMGTSK